MIASLVEGGIMLQQYPLVNRRITFLKSAGHIHNRGIKKTRRKRWYQQLTWAFPHNNPKT
jgi:hypothetical protein